MWVFLGVIATSCWAASGLPEGAPPDGPGSDRGACVELESHGGAADGLSPHPTDNAAPFADAADEALASGRPICLRAGTYYTGSEWRLNASRAGAEVGKVPSLHGTGMNATFVAIGNGAMDGLSFEGSLHAGNGVELRDFTVIQGGYTGNRYGDLRGRCLVVRNAPHIVLRNVRTMQCEIGFAFEGLQEALLENLIASFNNFGMKMSVGYKGVSRPNAIQIINGKFGSNFTNGFDIANPASVVFLGGSVEGNNPQGHKVDSRQQWGGRLVFNDTVLEGSTAATFIGTYFEANAGVADLYYRNGKAPSALVVLGSTFNRHAIHAEANIRFDTENGFQQSLILIGNGFRGYSDYQPSAARPYVRIGNPADPLQIADIGNIYVDSVERPAFPVQVAQTPEAPASQAIDPREPRPGTVYFNTTRHRLRAWDGAAWHDLW